MKLFKYVLFMLSLWSGPFVFATETSTDQEWKTRHTICYFPLDNSSKNPQQWRIFLKDTPAGLALPEFAMLPYAKDDESILKHAVKELSLVSSSKNVIQMGIHVEYLNKSDHIKEIRDVWVLFTKSKRVGAWGLWEKIANSEILDEKKPTMKPLSPKNEIKFIQSFLIKVLSSKEVSDYDPEFKEYLKSFSENATGRITINPYLFEYYKNIRDKQEKIVTPCSIL